MCVEEGGRDRRELFAPVWWDPRGPWLTPRSLLVFGCGRLPRLTKVDAGEDEPAPVISLICRPASASRPPGEDDDRFAGRNRLSKIVHLHQERHEVGVKLWGQHLAGIC